MAVPFIDLKRDTQASDAAVQEAMLRVLGHGQFILGPEVAAFEAAMSEFVDGAHVIGMSSGTDALLAALMAVGVEHGDAVITTPFSFFATAGVIARLGAKPRFVDIEPNTFGLDASKLEATDRSGVRALIPVHLFGHVLDCAPLQAWTKGEIALVEDAAQAINARNFEGKAAGTLSDIGAFSFFPTKNLGALGDAGMAVTKDDETAERLRRLRTHGQSSRYYHQEVGGNFRLDAIQAAALAAKLPFLQKITDQRRGNAKRYLQKFEAHGLVDGRLGLPPFHEHHSFHQFVIRVRDGARDRVQAGLKERGIGAAVYYPLSFHQQPCFADLGYEPGAFPESELAAQEVLALPVFPGLTETEQDEVVTALKDLL